MRGSIVRRSVVFLFGLATCFPLMARENWRADFREHLMRAALLLQQGGTPPALAVAPTNDFYLFVSGFLTDYTPGTFEATTSYLNQGTSGQIRSQVFVPNSMEGFELSADKFTDHLRQVISADPDRPMVLTGHSRGAVVLWISMMKNPELYVQHVRRIVFLQGAFGGSGLAESVNTLRAGLEATTWGTADLIRNGTSFAAGLFGQYLSSPLTPKAASKSVKDIIKEYSRSLPAELHERILFVATTYNMVQEIATKPLASHDLVMMACAAFTAWQSPEIKSDGVLHINDQAPPCARDSQKIVVEGFHHNGLTSGPGAVALAVSLQTI